MKTLQSSYKDYLRKVVNFHDDCYPNRTWGQCYMDVLGAIAPNLLMVALRVPHRNPTLGEENLKDFVGFVCSRWGFYD